MHSSFVSFFSGICQSLLYSITKFLKKSNQNQTAVLPLPFSCTTEESAGLLSPVHIPALSAHRQPAERLQQRYHIHHASE